MTQQIINIGNVPDDGKGDKLRPAFQKVNANFTELYAGAGLPSTGVIPGSYTSANLTVNAQGLLTAAANGSGGLVNINDILGTPLNPDGVTSNVPALKTLAPVLQSVSPEMPVPVNITIGSGSTAVLSLDPTVASGGTYPNPALHFLKPNQSFYLIQTGAGSLPNNISLNTPYYITSANLTATTFTFSTTNNYDRTQSEGSPVTTSGTFTGTFSIVLTGRDINLIIPPGAYFGGNYGDNAVPNLNLTPNGITRIRYFGYGAMFDGKVSFGTPQGIIGGYGDAATWGATLFDYVNTTPNDNNALNINGIVTLVTTANISRYFVGQYISIYGLNIQDSYNGSGGGGNSGPPNGQYQEFKRIIAVDVGAGALTLDGPLKWVYLSTFPKMITPNGAFVFSGAATIVPMHPSWDTEVNIRGVRWIGQPGAAVARRVLYEDCVFQGFGDYPAQSVASSAQSYTFRNCIFGPSMPPGQTYMEVDKMLEYLELDQCSAENAYKILFQSTSLQVCKIKGHRGGLIYGTPRQIQISDSTVHAIEVGAIIGVTDVCVIQNTQSTYFDMTNRGDDPFDLINSAVALQPGNDMTLVPNWSFSNGTFSRNLAGLPGLQGMYWQSPGAKIYMIDAGGVYSAGQNMGSPFTILNVTMSGSNFSFDTTLSTIPTRQTSHTVTITSASPGVFTWAAHGLIAGTPVVLTTTGVLLTGLSISTPYYVTNDGNLTANTFAVSSTRAGALAGTGKINTSGSQSGTHTAYGNPLCFRLHPCARFTGIGNRGCSTIIDQNGLIDEPLFSHVRRSFVGRQSSGNNASNLQVPNPRIWGFLKSMTVNVRKAGTASGTLTIGCPGFTQPNLALSNFSQVIDTTVAGIRSWTGSAAPTGSAGADTIAAYADWIAGPLVFAWSAGVTLPNSPIVEFEIFTDQAITRFGNMMGMPVAGTNLWQWIDSGIDQQYGALP